MSATSTDSDLVPFFGPVVLFTLPFWVLGAVADVELLPALCR
jgi:hypothetical protein